jgi:COP9 signalosome complex subunit 1
MADMKKESSKSSSKRDEKKADSDKSSKKSTTASKTSEKKEAVNKKKEIPVVVPSANFDLKNYSEKYVGHTKVTRLLFIAERYAEKQGDAYKLVVDALKSGKNTTAYRKLFEKLGNQLGAGYQFDQPWADVLDKQFMVEMEELENNLVNYKNNLLREQQRV